MKMVNLFRNTAERKRTEDELRESRDYLESLINYANAPIIVWDPQFLITRFNRAFEAITGRTEAEVVGQSLEILFPPNRVDASMELVRKAMEGEKWEVIEIPILHRDGSIRTVIWNSATIFSQDGKTAVSTIVQGQDITERKLTEEALGVSEVRYRRLFETAQDGILILDAETGMIVDVNPFLIEMLGYSHEQFIGKTVWELGLLKDFIPNWDNFLQLQRQEYIRYEDLPLETSDGHRINVEFVSNVYLVDHKKVIQCNIRDITERRRAEEALKNYQNDLERIVSERTEALRESEENFRRSLDDSPLGIRIITADGDLLYANQAILDMYGFDSVEELKATPHIKSYTPESYAKHKVRIEKRQRGEYVPPNYEISIIRKDGEIRYLEIFRKEVLWNGKPQFQVIYNDTTERKRAEARRLELERKYLISSRLASIGEMAAGIAHEINNPLSPIIGFADLLLKEDLPESVKTDLKIIRDCANRAADVTRGLLVFARQSKPMRKLYNINEVVETTIQLRLYHLKTNNIKVIKEIDPDIPKTTVDAAQMQQVLLNLIMNAEYAMSKAHGGGNLKVKTERNGNTIRVLVKDDGQGISSENMEKLFQPFFTTKNVGEGTGLGLSVCHGIVAEHNGKIYAESKEGAGATFIVELPIVRQDEKEEPAPSTPDAVKAKEAVIARILVVDDEPSIIQVLQRVLSVEGYEVEATGTAKEALKLIEGGNRYALILLDIKMPDMSGIELYQHLDKTFGSLTKRIIFITGDVLGTDTMDFFSRTGAFYITKPFDVEQLKKEIKNKLTQKV